MRTDSCIAGVHTDCRDVAAHVVSMVGSRVVFRFVAAGAQTLASNNCQYDGPCVHSDWDGWREALGAVLLHVGGTCCMGCADDVAVSCFDCSSCAGRSGAAVAGMHFQNEAVFEALGGWFLVCTRTRNYV